MRIFTGRRVHVGQNFSPVDDAIIKCGIISFLLSGVMVTCSSRHRIHMCLCRSMPSKNCVEEKCTMCYSSKWISNAVIDTQSPLTWVKQYPFIRASLIWTIHRHLTNITSQIVPKITDTVAPFKNRPWATGTDIFVQDHIKG